MGNSKFWFYPSNAQLVEIDLGEKIAELFIEFDVNASTGVSMSGQMRRITGLNREMITIQRDRFKLSEDLAIKLVALNTHLQLGGSCAFAVDCDLAWAAPIRNAPTAGQTRLQTLDNPFVGMVGAQSLSANDYIQIETAPPAALREQKKVSTWNISGQYSGSFDIDSSAPATSATNGVAFEYNSIAMARHYRFFPCLKMPQSQLNQNIVTNEHGFLFSLACTLTPDYHNYFRFHPDFQDFTSGLDSTPANPEYWGDDFTVGLENDSIMQRLNEIHQMQW